MRQTRMFRFTALCALPQALSFFIPAGAIAAICTRSAAAEQVAQFSTGGKVFVEQSPAGDWGIRVESPGMASVTVAHPMQLESYESETKIGVVAAGYKSIRKTDTGFLGEGDLVPVRA